MHGENVDKLDNMSTEGLNHTIAVDTPRAERLAVRKENGTSLNSVPPSGCIQPPPRDQEHNRVSCFGKFLTTRRSVNFGRVAVVGASLRITPALVDVSQSLVPGNLVMH